MERGDHRETILLEELVIVSQPELREPGGCNHHDEGGEVPSMVALEEEEALEVLQGAPFPVDGLEILQVVVILGVDIAVILGVMAGHPPEMLEPAQF